MPGSVAPPPRCGAMPSEQRRSRRSGPGREIVWLGAPTQQLPALSLRFQRAVRGMPGSTPVCNDGQCKAAGPPRHGGSQAMHCHNPVQPQCALTRCLNNSLNCP